jgi:hypothetical protein
MNSLCEECGEADPQFNDPRSPPLEIEPCLCRDCFIAAAGDAIAEIIDDVADDVREEILKEVHH